MSLVDPSRIALFLVLIAVSVSCRTGQTGVPDPSSDTSAELNRSPSGKSMSEKEPSRMSTESEKSTAPTGATAGTAKAGSEQATARETALLAGGCFWGMEEILRQIPGVLETEVGYTGGRTPSPSYEHVKRGNTGHAESVRIVFDPARLSYESLLENWFFKMHDPTTKNRQGNDVGTQYRSAIFVTSEEQRKIAERVKERVNRSGKWRAPIVTEIVEAAAFTPAEGYHQDYLQKNPGGYTCHYMRE